MKISYRVIGLTLLIIFKYLFPVFAEGKVCNTKYPIVLSYAWTGSVNHSFGRIPESLEYEGAEVYIAYKHACQSTMYRAQELKRSVLEILAVTGKSKVNIIGHCHGTLDSRYMIANLGMSDKVASWTSITGGHRGLVLFSLFSTITPDFFYEKVLDPNICFDDIDPDNKAAFICLGNGFMNDIFNPNTPNQPGVYYQSWVANIDGISFRNLVHAAPWLLVKIFEGENDGYVSNHTGAWGNFRGAITGTGPGVSHYDIVDNPQGVITEGFDVLEFYINIVKELKKRGF